MILEKNFKKPFLVSSVKILMMKKDEKNEEDD